MESEGLAGDLLIALLRGIVGGGRIAHQSAKLSHEFRLLSCHDSSRISFGASPFVLADCSLKSSTACPGCFPFFFVKITIGLTGERPLGLCHSAFARAGKFIGRIPAGYGDAWPCGVNPGGVNPCGCNGCPYARPCGSGGWCAAGGEDQSTSHTKPLC